MSERMTTEQQKIAEENMGLARRLAMRFGGCIDPDEAESTAMMALCRGVLSYDATQGIPMISHLECEIKNSLKNWKRRVKWERERGLSGGAPTMETINASTGSGRRIDRIAEGQMGTREMSLTLGSLDPDPETELYWAELFEILPKSLRSVAYAKWRERKTLEEVAEETDLSVAEVARRLTKAENYARSYLNIGGVA